MSEARQRVDLLLVEIGLAVSRAKAADLVKAGRVLVEGRAVDKPSTLVDADAAVSLTGSERQYVSRAALKLLHGLDHFRIDVAGKVALDIGASTGGFTEVLLERGAATVYAVDVGRDQLHASLRAEPRVVSLESLDARALDCSIIPQPVELIVSDVSFISLRKVLPAPLSLAADSCRLLVLVKPQFEVGPHFVGKGGIVKDTAAAAQAVDAVRDCIAAQPGWRVEGVVASPITGRDGNQEYLLGAHREIADASVVTKI
jgi:23S rRNA (cytidine1920-2'-O)/16S rRNA (cytidine1409-2'-O)-methyltransferase